MALEAIWKENWWQKEDKGSSSIGRLVTGANPEEFEKESEVRLEQRGESHWQEFLEASQSPQLEWKQPQLPQLQSEEAFNVLQNSLSREAGARQGLSEKLVSQSLLDLRGRPPEVTGSLESSVEVKEGALYEEEGLDRKRHSWEFWCQNDKVPQKVIGQNMFSSVSNNSRKYKT